jgi:hypothetical protein
LNTVESNNSHCTRFANQYRPTLESNDSAAIVRDIMMSTARSATSMTIAFVLELMIDGIIDASNTRKPLAPFTLRSGVNTDMKSLGRPILHVPTGKMSRSCLP